MRVALVALIASLMAASPAIAQSDVDRAVRNYQQLLSGKKQFYHLTPQERADVLELTASSAPAKPSASRRPSSNAWSGLDRTTRPISKNPCWI